MSFETLLPSEWIDKYTRTGHWKGRIITDDLDEAVRRTPDKLAVVDSRSRYTYQELKKAVDRCALGFLEMGIHAGDVVSFQLPNWNEFVIVHYAATRIGAVSNPLVPIYRDREIRFMLQLCQSKCLVIPREFKNFNYLEMIQRLRPELPFLEHLLTIGDSPAGEVESFSEFMATPWEERRDPSELIKLRPDANEVTEVIFTSGTTGEPKGVLHTHNTLMSANDPWAERLGLDDQSVIHMASTFAHQTGFLYGVRLATQLGCTGIFQDVWNAETFVEMIEQYGINMTTGATPFLHDFLNAKNWEKHDLSSLKRFNCIGAPVPRTLLRQARKKLPDAAVMGGWGQTEDALVTLGKPGDSEEKITTTDGFPWPGMEIRVVNDDSRPLPAGERGRLQCRGPFVFVGYAKRLDKTREEFTDDGWFDTGDLAVIDTDGYVSIAGRTKDIIVRGGENIPADYVENVLHENSKIDQVAVVAMPDPRLQEKACAFVMLKDRQTMSLEEMKDFLKEKGVAKQYWPERLEVVSNFPRTASGKIQKYQLREQIKEIVKEEGNGDV
jgi:cyclohexanecarboxylate-CoA ligase